MFVRYVEVPIPLPPRVTAHVDPLGNLRLRCNQRDLSTSLASEVQDALYEAGVSLAKALPDEEPPRE